MLKMKETLYFVHVLYPIVVKNGSEVIFDIM